MSEKKSFSLSIESNTFLVKEPRKKKQKKNLSFWVSTRIEKKKVKGKSYCRKSSRLEIIQKCKHLNS